MGFSIIYKKKGKNLVLTLNIHIYIIERARDYCKYYKKIP